jgi:hypothetical protein
MGRHPSAVGSYKIAIQRDFKTAVVFNNLGHSLMRMPEGTDVEAAECFRKAVKADPRLQIAYHNLATLVLKEASTNTDRISTARLKEGLDAIARAFELGPATAIGWIHRDAARLYVLAAAVEPRWDDLAFEHLNAAIERGVPPASLKDDRILRPLHGDARFRRLLERPVVSAPPIYTLRLLQGDLAAVEPKAQTYRGLQKAWASPDRVSTARLKEGLEAIARALELGPANGYVHLDAARLYVVAAGMEPRWKELAFENLSAASDRGLPPAMLKSDLILGPLRGDARFQRLIARPAVEPPETPVRRFLDPLQDK